MEAVRWRGGERCGRTCAWGWMVNGMMSGLCQGVRKSYWPGLGLGCGTVSAHWLVALSKAFSASQGPQASEPIHQAKCVSVFQLPACVGESPTAHTLGKAWNGTLVQTRVIDSLAGRADTFSDETVSNLDLPHMLCALGLPVSS